MIVCYVNFSHTVFSVFCFNLSYVGASGTVFFVLCLVVCHVSVPCTVFSVFCLTVVMLVSHVLFFLVLFDCLLRQCLSHCFLLAVFDFATLMSRALFSLSSVRLFVTFEFCLAVYYICVSRTFFFEFCFTI